MSQKQRKEKSDKKKKKSPIKNKNNLPQAVRDATWNLYIGQDQAKGKCHSCEITVIFRDSFEAGHVISRNNGGSDNVTNLRPICTKCNKSMGTKNMEEFKKTYFSGIGSVKRKTKKDKKKKSEKKPKKEVVAYPSSEEESESESDNSNSESDQSSEGKDSPESDPDDDVITTKKNKKRKSDEKNESPCEVQTQLKKTIFGVPGFLTGGATAYDSGDKVGCYTMYRDAAKSIVEQATASDQDSEWWCQVLQSALKKAAQPEAQKNWGKQTDGAWVLRKAFDTIREEEIIAEHVEVFLNQAQKLYGLVVHKCECPQMTAGQNVYLWAEGVAASDPAELPARDYITTLFTWIESLTQNKKLFPPNTSKGVTYPAEFIPIVKTIYRRLFRVYAHIYHSHITQIKKREEFTSSLKWFYTFVTTHHLVDMEEMEPLEKIVKDFD